MEKKTIIGMIVPTVDNPFFASLVCQVERVLKAQGFGLLVCSSANDAETEKDNFRLLLQSGVRGILCVSGLSALPESLVPEDCPLVWIDRVPQSDRPIPWVANDDAQAMEEAADYLIEKGCKNILLLPGFLAEGQQSPRVAGYRKALETHEIPFREEYVLRRSGKQSTEAETEELVQSILRRGLRIDGILASSDRSAFGAIAALRSVGLYVPEDVKLICFDNSPYSTMATPAITALDRNPDRLAQTACQLLLRRLAGKAELPIQNVVPVSVVKRDSTR